MPNERIYSIRGLIDGSATGHEEIQLNFEKENGKNFLYKVLKFDVYSASPNTIGSVTGALTKAKNDSYDPATLDLEDETVLAWAQQIRRTPIPPGLGEVASAYADGFIDDDKYFSYDLHVHTNNTNTSVDVNYYILLEKFSVSEVGAIAESINQIQLENV